VTPSPEPAALPPQARRRAILPTLARRLGPFDAAMIVMGGIVGSGIFINPAVVARRVPSAPLVLLAWLAGGGIAMLGAFLWAELAARLPGVGGQYAYLREAYHPLVAFLYGWTLLLVIQSGGMAAVAITFSRYLLVLTPLAVPEGFVAVTTLALLVLVNILGVRAGSNVQSALMVTKIGAILFLVFAGFAFAPARPAAPAAPFTGPLLLSFGAALVPVFFAYGGWQTASFLSGEMKRPERDLPRGLILGVLGVVALYLAVNAVCLHVLGAAGLAATKTPASEVMRLSLGNAGSRILSIGIAVSTLGFLSHGILTAPRAYFAMAQDGVFFRAVARLHPTTRVPVAAIVLQGTFAAIIALSGQYEEILNYVVSVDFIFFGLTGAAVLVFRRRDRAEGRTAPVSHPMPGHPWTTIFFAAGCWFVALNAVIDSPRNTAIGLFILLAGVPVFFFWKRRRFA
jgi:APA family basic amino acid/polyamine antiporter